MNRKFGVVLLGFGLFSQVAGAAPTSYMGDFCWGAYQGDSAELAVFRAGVVRMGKSGHYLLTGNLNDGSEVVPFTGGAERIGNKLHVNLTSSYINGNFATFEQINILLNKKVFKSGGKFTILARDYNMKGKSAEPLNLTEGTLRTKSCR